MAQLGSGDDDTLAGTTGEPGVPVTEFATIAEPTMHRQCIDYRFCLQPGHEKHSFMKRTVHLFFGQIKPIHPGINVTGWIKKGAKKVKGQNNRYCQLS